MHSTLNSINKMMNTTTLAFLISGFLLIGQTTTAQYTEEQRKQDATLDAKLTADIKSNFAYVDNFHYGLALVKNERCQWGIIDGNGKKILSPSYNHIEYTDGLLVKATLLNKHFYWLRSTDNKLTPLQYDEVHLAPNQLLRVQSNGLWGMVSTNGKGVALMRYESFKPIENRGYDVVFKEKHGVLDINGQEILPVQYQAVYAWGEDRWIGMQDGVYKLYDNAGKLLIEGIDNINQPRTNDAYLAVQKDGKWGLMAKDGNMNISYTYSKLFFAGGQTVAAYDMNHWNIIDINNKDIYTTHIMDVHIWENNATIMAVRHHDDWKLIHTQTGKMSEQTSTKKPELLTKIGVAVMYTKEGKKQLLDTQLKPFGKGSYEQVSADASLPYILVLQNGKWGLLANENFVEPSWEKAMVLSDRFVATFQTPMWSVYDIENKKNGSIEMDAVERLGETEWLVCEQNGKKGILDKNAQFWIKPAYDNILDYNLGWFLVENSGESYWINAEGKRFDCR